MRGITLSTPSALFTFMTSTNQELLNALKLAQDALATCRSGGYTDVDGDYITTHHFDNKLVDKAKAAVASALDIQARSKL